MALAINIRSSSRSIKAQGEQLRRLQELTARYFERAWIEVVIWKDEAGKDFNEKYFKGPLHKQLREALSFIRTNIIVETVRKVTGQAEANRFYNFPFEVVEEALANAVYHKSYELGAPVEVQVWPDKIEILSFPGPVPPVNAQILAENKRIVARSYRNRRVGDFLKELLSKIDLSNQTKNYQRHIEPLITENLLRMTIPESPKNRNQQYVTTQKGQETLNAHAAK